MMSLSSLPHAWHTRKYSLRTGNIQGYLSEIYFAYMF